MNTKTYLILTLCLLAALPACRGKAPEKEGVALDQTEIIPVTDSTYVLREDVVALVESPGRHFERADRRFDGHERVASAGELRAAAQTLLRRASHADGPPKADLDAAAQQLENLAERLVLGPEVTHTEFDGVVARAYRALAAYHRQRAETAWARGQAGATALELNAVAVYLEQATEFVEEGPAETHSTEEVVQQTEELARSLAEGQRDTREDVQQVFVKLGQEIDHLGQRLDAGGAS